MRILSFFKKYPRIWYVIILLPVILLTMRCLPYEPRIWMDEGMYVQLARNVVETGHYALQIAPGVYAPPTVITTGPAVILLSALSMKLFGLTMYAARLGMVVYLVAFIIVMFAFLKRQTNLIAALIGISLLVFFNPLYSNGKVVSGEVPALFFGVLGLLALMDIEQGKQRNSSYFLLGLWLGLAMTTKTIFLLMPVAAFIAALVFYKKMNITWRHLGWAAAGLAVTIIFWGIFYLGNITELWSVIRHNINVYGGVEKTSDLVRQNILLFKKIESPLYFLLLLMMTGGIMLARWRKRVLTVTELTIGFYGLFSILNFLRLDPWYRYFFPAEVLLIAILPFELWWFTQALNERVHKKLFRSIIMVSAGATIMGMLALHISVLYKKQYGACYAEGTESQKTTMKDLAAQGKSIYFLNTPDPAFFIPNNDYRQYLEITRVISIGQKALNEIKAGIADFVVTRDIFVAHDAQYLGRYSFYKEFSNFKIWQKNDLPNLRK